AAARVSISLPAAVQPGDIHHCGCRPRLVVVSDTGGAFTGTVTDPRAPLWHRCRDAAGCSPHAQEARHEARDTIDRIEDLRRAAARGRRGAALGDAPARCARAHLLR